MNVNTLDTLNAAQLRRLLTEHLTEKKLGLYWESNAIERDAALNSHIVLPRLVAEKGYSHHLENVAVTGTPNLIIEGDNFDSLRLLKSTHAGKIRVIYIDPPYNTGNKDWVYNDHYVGANDRWRHSQWLEFLYRRLLLAKDLLTQDGVIMVSINDENRARLELLMDEVFPMRRLGSLVWRTRQGSNDAKGSFLSEDHEHVLVYGNNGFRFKGFGKSYEMYSNPDNDPRGDWRPDNLNQPKDYKQRPNTFYPIKDSKTDIYYPANPDAVWRYSSRERIKEGQKLETKTMEEFIELGQILFPKEQPIVIWNTMSDLLQAIDVGDVPKSGKSPMLRRELPNLEYWIGKKVGFGRPAFKRYKSDLRNDTQPLSSWVVPKSEKDEYEAEGSFISGTSQEGARDVAALFGDKAFNYAKPLSLIQNLLSQATRPGDIVLDFFAGSGTTGHAVLALNALEPNAAPRSFILCSSTEATTKEPDKNLCRDVCAARIRKVIESDSKFAHNHFAYLQLEKIVPSDTPFETDRAHAFQLLTLRLGKVARPLPQDELAQQGIYLLLQNTEDGALTVYIDQPTPSALDALATLKAPLRIYSTRPDTVKKHLNKAWAKTDKTFEAISLHKALVHG